MITTHSTVDYDALVKEDRIHGKVYLQPDIFEDEIATVFHQGWVYVGHTSEIPEPGDYRLAQIGWQSVIMTRDEDRKIHLLMNRCTHRANAVCQSERGNPHAFRYSYHGWTFLNNGDLTGVTYPKRYSAAFNKSDYGLRPVPRVGIYRGFIFASLSSEGILLDDHLGNPVKAQLDLFIDFSPEGELDVRSGTHKYGYHPNFTHQTMIDAARRQR